MAVKNKLTDFENEVLEVIKKIKKGRVSTYREAARALGRPKAARAVGNALNKNPHAPKVPCHRIVKSDGALGGYAGGAKKKAELLGREGLAIIKGKIKDFNEKFMRL
ncbi:MAG: MGMT family protein [Patescibacteria group bacterium]|jgi:methylated-DNA-[protein]-cysteine S-methyltransferase